MFSYLPPSRAQIGAHHQHTELMSYSLYIHIGLLIYISHPPMSFIAFIGSLALVIDLPTTT